MSERRFRCPGEMEEGQLVLGVVYHVVRQAEIYEMTGHEPMGYIVEDEESGDE